MFVGHCNFLIFEHPNKPQTFFREIDVAHIHADFNKTFLWFDIAVLKVTSPFLTTFEVRPIILAKQNYVDIGRCDKKIDTKIPKLQK